MSMGERIAQKRKELGLSQESLGEQMGVSRQAIYKWESDATLPEIEKLVVLARLFGVSVGWLLGVEEKSAPEQPEEHELTAAQLKMVSEIVDRYIQAQPQPKPRRKWPWVLAAVAVCAVAIWFSGRLDQITNQYSNLQNSVGNISYSVNSQINGIAGRVEEILKAQNNLTAEFDTSIVSTDYRSGTLTMTMEAVPKTYVADMSAVFVVDCGSSREEFPGTLAEGLTFSAEVQVPLTDSITVSVVFVGPDGTRQTQVLDSYSWLLSESYAELNIRENLMFKRLTDGKLVLKNEYVWVDQAYSATADAQITSYQVGIFRNQQLLGWAKKCDQPANYRGFDGYQFFRLPELTIGDLGKDDTIEIAALVTDSYGRQYMCYDIPYRVDYHTHDGTAELTWVDEVFYSREPDQWTFG